LLVFGAIHGAVIWEGDVLFEYAVLGFGTMLCRSWSVTRLLKTGFGLYCGFRLVALVGDAIGLDQQVDFYTAAGPEFFAQLGARFAGSLQSSFEANLHEWIAGLPGTLVFEWFQTWPLMLVGLGLYKLDFFSGRWPAGIYRALVAAAGLSVIVQTTAALGDVGLGNTATSYVMSELERQLAPVIALGYAAVLILATGTPRFAWLPRLLAPVGRMAFTNYLTQSLVMTAIFYGGRGPGLYGQVDRPALIVIVIAVWTVQITWSTLWLRHFESGPFEWVWRRLYRGRDPVASAA
jgi:uncharacterized protein